MMIENHEHIYQLLLEKRNGTISEADDARVAGLIDTHEEIALMWRALKHSYITPGEERFWQQIDENAAWNNVKSQLTIRSRRVRMNRALLMAAAITVLAALAISVIWRSGIWQKETPLPVAVNNTGNTMPGLQLQLANGTTVALPYNQPRQQITAGDVQLSAGAKQLQYASNTKMGEGFNTLTVPPKMDYKLALSDGTEVWLNATSKLRFPFAFDGDKREVYLEGEGYFNVARKDGQPFIVHTAHTDITVLGTTFNVNAYNKDVTTTSLVTGKVLTRSGDREVTLKPGQEVAFNANNKFSVDNFDTDEVLAWMRGLYVFHNTSLEHIAAVIERWYGVKVVFDDPSLAGKKFTGGLEKLQTLDYFLETLQIIGDVDHYYDKDVLHLKLKR
ncbi:FecR domain-containing protein [Chitinophaga sp.]|uniref:FecR family protein n=1 Tax=Chitinophaga sp. TaxID=1869181 RepID=UPI0031DF847C